LLVLAQKKVDSIKEKGFIFSPLAGFMADTPVSKKG
jgi:hypothetical protein